MDISLSVFVKMIPLSTIGFSVESLPVIQYWDWMLVEFSLVELSAKLDS